MSGVTVERDIVKSQSFQFSGRTSLRSRNSHDNCPFGCQAISSKGLVRNPGNEVGSYAANVV